MNQYNRYVGWEPDYRPNGISFLEDQVMVDMAKIDLSNSKEAAQKMRELLFSYSNYKLDESQKALVEVIADTMKEGLVPIISNFLSSMYNSRVQPVRRVAMPSVVHGENNITGV